MNKNRMRGKSKNHIIQYIIPYSTYCRTTTGNNFYLFRNKIRYSLSPMRQIIRMSILQSIVCLILLNHVSYFNPVIVTALVSTVPQKVINKNRVTSQTIIENTQIQTVQRKKNDLSSIRIRSTKEFDLPTIIDLLAFEASNNENQRSNNNQSQNKNPLFGNWNLSFKQLKNEASLTSQLTQRFAAKQRAEKVLSMYNYQQKKKMENDELRHVLWADDTFRNKLEKAVQTTSIWERTIWDNWNFALTPESNMLHHCMITALDDEFIGTNADDESASVVGFCEIGICNIPSNYDCEEGQCRYMPCVGNLVVSPNHRRRGIGKKLIQSAVRLLRLTSFHSDSENNSSMAALSLYVHKDNLQAIRLYESEGFVATGRCEEYDNERIFMTLSHL